jgi:hypothetical protein
LDDHDLIYEVRRAGFSVMVTGNYKMINDGRVLVAVLQTRLCLLTMERAGDDAVFATGVLLRDLVPVLRAQVAKGQIYRLRPQRPRALSARSLLEQVATAGGTTTEAMLSKHGRAFQQRQLPQGSSPPRK